MQRLTGGFYERTYHNSEDASHMRQSGPGAWSHHLREIHVSKSRPRESPLRLTVTCMAVYEGHDFSHTPDVVKYMQVTYKKTLPYPFRKENEWLCKGKILPFS